MTNPAIMTNLAIAANGLRKSYRGKEGDKVVLQPPVNLADGDKVQPAPEVPAPKS